MLDEAGMVMDDGVTACISDTQFLMTTTTGGAARVMTWLEKWHQTEWPELEVYMTSVTDHWATSAPRGHRAGPIRANRGRRPGGTVCRHGTRAAVPLLQNGRSRRWSVSG